MPEFKRNLNLTEYSSSQFIFGPRMCGKTHLLRTLGIPHYFNLLNPDEELRLKANPSLFWNEIQTVSPNETIIIDEVQRVPALLDFVQLGIDQRNLRFLLSGSSARKLKRGHANLLGGRAIERKLHPLTQAEIGDTFQIATALAFGTLPKVYELASSGRLAEARSILASYYSLYIKEEIQAEAITRNIPAFQRFLNVAAQSHGHIVEYSNIASDSKVPPTTVKEYFTILEDTLIGHLLWPWDRSERKKARPKFYIFDPGVLRALQNRLYDPPTGQELGFLFEGWFIREVVRLRDYLKPYVELSFWRHGQHEIDLAIERSGKISLAIEVKSGVDPDLSPAVLATFRKRFPHTRVVVASLRDERPRIGESGVEILPWRTALETFLTGV